MQNYARLVGIDVGKKRIGVAQTDLLKTFASPVGTFAPDEVISKLKAITSQAKVDKFVVGWPLNPAGEEGRATQMVQEFINKLNRTFPDITIVKVDERYTSNIAQDLMIEAGVPKKKRQQKGRVDRIAAAVILQKYLDSNS
ncbi:Holliday junction resolvase RuvX [Gracilimonas mengyeensis]|uniref:Putative pre-16S rRNA nuclease n=1 Tax=Gracilimonas mengyeensis TaxID=1302730 RepID=A0A521DFD8_9BACT|nr:Holliday junction resolvase RuvX [Gracilimonas mengyeensis]SMO70429.1 putative holliday junction resolvase [Gracilimonas mengyeensis]